MSSFAGSTAHANIVSISWRFRFGAWNVPMMLSCEHRFYEAFLPKLISGELRVKDVEKILEDAEI